MNIQHSLLSKGQFREAVFARDRGACVVCAAPAQDPHHIIDRRLWADGGYYLANGAAVCAEHHWQCESTEISVEQIRKLAGIHDALLPEQLEVGQVYDKWGNPVLPNKQRMRGELFFDDAVQKVLGNAGFLDLFTTRVKYPRTYHLSWSEGLGHDDRVMRSLKHFEGRRVIVTVKMDGENSTTYSDYFHARSLDSKSDPARNWVKRHVSTFQHEIPEAWRLCAENLFERKSVSYENLATYFFGISMWNERNRCLSWDNTMEWFEMLGVTPTPKLYDGIFDKKLIQQLFVDERDREGMEGYVVRLADEFSYAEFRECVGKFVRKDHLQGEEKRGNRAGRLIVRNGLIGA